MLGLSWRIQACAEGGVDGVTVKRSAEWMLRLLPLGLSPAARRQHSATRRRTRRRGDSGRLATPWFLAADRVPAGVRVSERAGAATAPTTVAIRRPARPVACSLRNLNSPRSGLLRWHDESEKESEKTLTCPEKGVKPLVNERGGKPILPQARREQKQLPAIRFFGLGDRMSGRWRGQ